MYEFSDISFMILHHTTLSKAQDGRKQKLTCSDIIFGLVVHAISQVLLILFRVLAPKTLKWELMGGTRITANEKVVSRYDKSE